MPVRRTQLGRNTTPISDTTPQQIIAAPGANQRIVILLWIARNTTAAERPTITLQTTDAVPVVIDQARPGDPATPIVLAGIFRNPAFRPIYLPAGVGLNGVADSAVGDTTVFVLYQLQSADQPGTLFSVNAAPINSPTPQIIVPPPGVGLSLVLHELVVVNATGGQFPAVELQTTSGTPFDVLTPGDPAANVANPGAQRITYQTPLVLDPNEGVQGLDAASAGASTVIAQFTLQRA